MAFDFTTCSFAGSSLDLSNKNLDDDDIARLVVLLSQHPNITSLDLRNNDIDPLGAQRLAANTTVRTLRLQGNRRIKPGDLDPFLNNHTLTMFPVFGSGPKVNTMRAHIKKNANPVVVAVVPVDAAPATAVAPLLNAADEAAIVEDVAVAAPLPAAIVETEMVDRVARRPDFTSGEAEHQVLLAAASLDPEFNS